VERKQRAPEVALPGRILDAVTQSGGRTWLAVFGLTLVVFAVTSHWWTGQVSDAIGAEWPAWQLAHHGTLDLTGIHGLPHDEGFLRLNGRVVAPRTMGVLLIAIPLNFLLGWTSLTAVQVGAFTASIVTAIAVANISVVLRTLVTPRRAILAALLLAFGTGMWTIASAELWTHGPTTMWLSLGLIFLARERFWLAGIALSPAITTRPHLAFAVAVIGLTVGWAQRSVKPVLALAVPAVAAVGVLLAWNTWYFGQTTLASPPYGSAIDVATQPLTGSTIASFAQNVAGTLVSGWCGCLLYSPVLVVLLLAIPAGWRAAPPYARGAMLGGLAYLAVQLHIDTFNGGGTYYGNRLVLELLVLSTPLAAVGYTHWSAGRPWRVAATTSLAAVSVGIFTTGTLLADYRIGGDFSDWTTWYPVMIVRSAGVVGLLVVAIVGLGVLFSIRESLRTAMRASAGEPESDALVSDLPARDSADVLDDERRFELEQPREQTVDEAR
jgi:hypothetical protein